MKKTANPVQQLLILALLKQKAEFEEVKSVLENLLYLACIAEVTHAEKLEKPVKYTDPTGLFSIENPYSSYMNNFLLDAWYLLVNTANDAVHGALEGMGFFPVAGEFADGLNALIYAFQGEYGDAALSTAAMIPLIGDLAGKGGKVGKFFTKYGDELTQYLSKHTDDALQGIESFVRNKLGKNADEVIDAVNTAAKKVPKFSQQAADNLVKASKKLFGGNVTVMKDGKPIFRVHQPGTHGNTNSTLSFLKKHVNPNNNQHFYKVDSKVSQFTQESYDMMNKALKNLDGFTIKTRGGN